MAITPEALVSNQMATLLDQESPYIKTNIAKAKEEANKLGLLSSSMAVGAGRRAAIESALPIAQQDAKTYAASILSAQEAGQKQEQSLLEEVFPGLHFFRPARLW